VIATPWCWWVVFLPCWPFPASVGRLPPIAITIAPDSLLHPQRPHLQLPCASWRSLLGLEGTRLLSRLLQRPNAGWTGCAHWYGKAWNAAFGAAGLGLLDTLAGWCWGWALASCQPGFIPQEDDSQVRGVRGLPVVDSNAAARAGWWRRSGRWWPTQKLVGSATSTRPPVGDSASKQRHLSSCAYNRWSTGTPKQQQQRTSPQRLGLAWRTDPRATVLLSSLPCGGFQQRGGVELETARHQRRRPISATSRPRCGASIASANATDA